jgi:hypothetical protein
MDVDLKMYILNLGVMGKEICFPLLAFHPGGLRSRINQGIYWADGVNDKKLMPVAHLMEQAFRLNQMVIYKKSDHLTAPMIRSQIKKKVFMGMIEIFLKQGNNQPAWQGAYHFDFQVQQMSGHLSDHNGGQYDIAMLKIVDKTESFSDGQGMDLEL